MTMGSAGVREEILSVFGNALYPWRLPLYVPLRIDVVGQTTRFGRGEVQQHQ
jgi:hypothetical protein